MNLMAMLARYGNVQPSDFEQLDYLEARELAARVVGLHNEEVEQHMKFHVEMTKAIIRAQGAHA